MIVVNLLPEELRPIKRTPLPHLLSLMLLAFAVAGMGLMFFGKLGEISDRTQELVQAKKGLDELKDVVDEYNALSEKKLQLENKINVIQEILSDRIIWSKQLHGLASLTPENFWYKRIWVTYKTVREEHVVIDEKTGKPEIDKRTKKEKVKTVNVKRPMLEISGYVINNEEGSNKINPLTFNTTEDPEFASIFTLDRPQILDAEYNGYAVRGFVLEYEIEAGGGN
ncbi:MAG: hypothetical protein L3K26_14655 [Candidatus Hydrogenedentes bacterium]|nr:hypothetical protein [Candidatus Hydrogenedentota bacterium]